MVCDQTRTRSTSHKRTTEPDFHTRSLAFMAGNPQRRGSTADRSFSTTPTSKWLVDPHKQNQSPCNFPPKSNRNTRQRTFAVGPIRMRALTFLQNRSLSSSLASRLLAPAAAAIHCSMGSRPDALVWFRKGLRIHDNPALHQACEGSARLYPVFVLDPYYLEQDPTSFSPGSPRSGLNRIRFLLESLVDLDSSLTSLGSRLLVLRGDPADVIIRLLKEVVTTTLGYLHSGYFILVGPTVYL